MGLLQGDLNSFIGITEGSLSKSICRTWFSYIHIFWDQSHWLEKTDLLPKCRISLIPLWSNIFSSLLNAASVSHVKKTRWSRPHCLVNAFLSGNSNISSFSNHNSSWINLTMRLIYTTSFMRMIRAYQYICHHLRMFNCRWLTF